MISLFTGCFEAEGGHAVQDQRGLAVSETQGTDLESVPPALREALLRRAAEGDRRGLAYFDNRMRPVERRPAS